MRESLHKTLIIRFSSIGDIVLSSLLVRTLRDRFPEAEIDYLVKSEYADLVHHNPHISHVLQFSPADGLSGHRQRIRSAEYDMIIDIHDSLRSRYLCFGHPNVVRINKRKLARFLLVRTKLNLYNSFGGSPSVAERYLETVEPLGVKNDGKGLELFLGEVAASRADAVLKESGVPDDTPLIGICPTSRHFNKMWQAKGFSEVGAMLAQSHSCSVVVFGSTEEAGPCAVVVEMIKALQPQLQVLNLAGRLSLLETAAVMDRCSVVVSNDSGLMHIAAARQRKVVAVFGPTVQELGFFPYGTISTVVEHESLSCRPCTHIGLPNCPLGHFKCMKEISPGVVLAAAEDLLRN